MAQFTHSLCEEVIRTEGRCGLTRNEMVQMARLALRQLQAENERDESKSVSADDVPFSGRIPSPRDHGGK